MDLALAPLVPFLRALKRSGRPHLPVFYREGDIDSLLSVDGLHVVFCFGAAFLESTLHHIVKLCSKTSSVHDCLGCTGSKKAKVLDTGAGRQGFHDDMGEEVPDEKGKAMVLDVYCISLSAVCLVYITTRICTTRMYGMYGCTFFSHT